MATGWPLSCSLLSLFFFFTMNFLLKGDLAGGTLSLSFSPSSQEEDTFVEEEEKEEKREKVSARRRAIQNTTQRDYSILAGNFSKK